MKTIKVDGALSESVNYRLVRLVKIEVPCPTCGVTGIPQKIYGVLYIPKGLGVPDSINVRVKAEGKK